MSNHVAFLCKKYTILIGPFLLQLIEVCILIGLIRRKREILINWLNNRSYISLHLPLPSCLDGDFGCHFINMQYNNTFYIENAKL